MNQTTIKESCLIPGGQGLHSGRRTHIAFHPAPADHGIIFLRSDKNVKIPADWRHAESSALCTTIVKEGVELTTVEHLLSVCSGMGIDNLLVELDAEEVPIFDGSGYAFFEKFSEIGLRELDQAKRVIRLLKPIQWVQGEISISAMPSEEPHFTFSIDFEHDQVGKQEFQFHFTRANYAEQIVRAKTFCREEDIPKMQEMGLVKGGSEKNAIILAKDGGFKNMENMTWLNEPNLHKILDQIGDFYLAKNMHILGNFFSHRSGHASHLAFLKYLLEERQDAWEEMAVN